MVKSPRLEATEICGTYIVLKDKRCASIQEFRAVQRLLESMLGIKWGEESKQRNKEVLHAAKTYRTNILPMRRRARDLARLMELKLDPSFSLPHEFTKRDSKKRSRRSDSSIAHSREVRRMHENMRRERIGLPPLKDKKKEQDELDAEIKVLASRLTRKPPDDAA